MPFNQQHMVLGWQGTWKLQGAPNGQAIEIASGTLRFAGPGLDQADSDFNLAAIALVLARYWNDSSVQIPGNCFLDVLKWNRIGTDGRYVDESNSRQVVITPQSGSGAAAYPTQVAWATTWQTDAVRGLAARGRTFWPTSRSFDGNNMKVSAANCLTKATRDAQLLRDLTDAARSGFVADPPQEVPLWASALGWDPSATRDGSGVTPMIMSKIGAGTSRVITSVGVGDRLDIQRRRANQMTDIRQTVDV